jgi:AmmeMemoRadiSam system protein A
VLADVQKTALLRLARDAIAAHLRGDPETAISLEEFAELQNVHAGVFISLHRGDELRGCIGNLEHLKPLPESVQAMAVAAACHDPRFEPLRPEELAHTRIEISVISPLQTLAALDELRVGTHGLMVRLGKRHGLLLPQVAAHRNWDAQTFLRHVCRKANLAEDAWQNPKAELFYFSAEVFSDGVG